MPIAAKVDVPRICREAGILANRRGLDRLSMNDLAQALGIRTPSLYSHVEGIDDVKRFLALHGLAELDAVVARATIGRSGADAIRALLDAYRQFAEKNPGIYAATVPTPPRSDREWSGAVDKLMVTFITAMQGYALRGPAVVHALRGLRSLVHGFVSLESEGALKHPVDRDESFAWLVDSFVAALEKMSARPREKRGEQR
jgi:AcrR family transcriptional regulator